MTEGDNGTTSCSAADVLEHPAVEVAIVEGIAQSTPDDTGTSEVGKMRLMKKRRRKNVLRRKGKPAKKFPISGEAGGADEVSTNAY